MKNLLIPVILSLLAIGTPGLANTKSIVVQEQPYVCDLDLSASVTSRFVNIAGTSVLAIQSSADSVDTQTAGAVFNNLPVDLSGQNDLDVIISVKGDDEFFNNVGINYTIGGTFRETIQFSFMTVIGKKNGYTQLNLRIPGASVTDFAIVGYGGVPYSGSVEGVIFNLFGNSVKQTKNLKTLQSCAPGQAE